MLQSIENQMFLETMISGTPEEAMQAIRNREELEQAEAESFQAGY